MVCYEQGIQKKLINSSCESSISMRHLPKYLATAHLLQVCVFLHSSLCPGPSMGPLWRHSFSSVSGNVHLQSRVRLKSNNPLEERAYKYFAASISSASIFTKIIMCRDSVNVTAAAAVSPNEYYVLRIYSHHLAILRHPVAVESNQRLVTMSLV